MPSFLEGGAFESASLRKTPGGRVSLHSPEEPNASQPMRLDYLLMSSFASRRFSNGWRNGFVASGAPLIACVISFAAVGKSPVFDEIRASARWLTQWFASFRGTWG